MADQDNQDAEASAEKAYAAAAQAVSVKSEPDSDLPVHAAAPAAPVEFPAKAKRGRKPASAKLSPEPVAVESVPIEPIPADIAPAVAAPKRALPKPRLPIKIAAASAKSRLAPKTVRASKPAAVPKPASVAKAKPAVAKPVAMKTALKAARPAKAKLPSSSIISPLSQIKDKTMTTATDITDGIQKFAAEAQGKAKKAFEKGSTLMGGYTEFTKGNVDAFVESGKILTAGLQEFGTSVMTESKTAFETMTGDFKDLAAAKSPTDYLSLQTDIMRRNFDKAVSFGSKKSEAMLKLASDSFAPLSGRVSLAVAKVRKAA